MLLSAQQFACTKLGSALQRRRVSLERAGSSAARVEVNDDSTQRFPGQQPIAAYRQSAHGPPLQPVMHDSGTRGYDV